MRGDDLTAARYWPLRSGTPPRARGRRARRRRGGHLPRNTPACAGTTRRGATPRPARTEHPRVRGDDSHVCRKTYLTIGTPPRARGRRHLRQAHPRRSGNTPACAGTTRRRAWSGGGCWEHPRVRGDDGPNGCRRLALRGTPPRARGRLDPTRACAAGDREHPRVRGDDPARIAAVASCGGTPPRARGRRDAGARSDRGRRNTPACAGTTLADLQLYVRQREDSFSGSRSALEMPVHGFKWRDKRVRSSTVPVVGGWRVESRPAGITGGSVCSCVPGAPLAGGQDPGSNDHGGWPGSRGGQPALGPGAAGRVRRPLHRDVACSTTGHCRASRRGPGRTRRRRARRPRSGTARTGGRCAPAAGPPSPSPAATRC